MLSLYQIGALTNIQWQVDGTLATFLDKMAIFAQGGTVIDMAEWLQLYTFDTIGGLLRYGLSKSHPPKTSLISSQFGKPFGFLEKGVDIADMIATSHSYSRYSAVMGVFSEWHPTIFRLLQMMAPRGEVGIGYIYEFAGRCIAEWNQRSGNEKSVAEEGTEGGDSLDSDFLGSLLSKHRRNPDNFTVDDALPPRHSPCARWWGDNGYRTKCHHVFPLRASTSP